MKRSRQFKPSTKQGFKKPRRAAPRRARFSSRTTPEIKFHDINVDDAVVALSLNITNLTVIPEGVGEEQRIGRKINLTKIQLQGAITLASGSDFADASDHLTCMIVLDTQTNGVQFTATDLLETDTFDSFRNLSNGKRFKILWKGKYTLSVSGGAPSGAALVTGEDITNLEAYLDVNIPIEYDNSATSGVITSVRQNNVYFVTITKSNSVAIDAKMRLRFSD